MAAQLNASQEFKSKAPKKVKPQQQCSYESDAHPLTGMTRAVRGLQTPPPVSPKPEREKAFNVFQIPPPIPPKPNEGKGALVTQIAISHTPPLSPSSPVVERKSATKGSVDAINSPSRARRSAELSKPISLKELARRYSKSFPLRVRTLEGFRGQTSQLSISLADEYSIHFIKHQKMVTIKDASRQQYSIPINSAIRFGLIYNPEKQPAVSSTPFIFESVSDIIALKTLPKVVCARIKYVGDTDRASVSANEVLCIIRVHKPKFHGRKSLEVFSLVTNAKKLLALECCGQFSTDPSLVQMHLPSILDHIPNLFPCQAILFADEDFTRSVPYTSSSLLSSPITLIDCKTRSSLVASPVINMEVPFEDGDGLIDIPLDEPLADVKIAIIQPDDDSETKTLQSKTQTLFENIDLSKIQSYQDAASDNIYATQSLLNFSLERGHERVGVEIDAPSSTLSRVPPQVESMVSAEEHPVTSDEDELYETVSPNKGGPGIAYVDMQPATTKEKHSGAIDSDDNSDYEILEKSASSLLTEKVEKLQKQVQSLERRFSSQQASQERSTKSLDEQIKQLTQQLKSLGTQFTQSSMNSIVQGSGSQVPKEDSRGCSSRERNRTALQHLSVTQIQQLLGAMQLPQYKEAFQREQIDGEVLIELDEQILESDLQISSKIHRIRLMKLISGNYSAEDILASTEK